jgi:hypothetical protein
VQEHLPDSAALVVGDLLGQLFAVKLFQPHAIRRIAALNRDWSICV